METTWLVVLLQLCIQIFAFPVYLLWYLGLWGPFCKKAFPYFMARMTIDYNKKMGDKKKELFSNLMDFAGPKGVLRLLEIGTGTGSNFQFYPRGCRITCTDLNPNFSKLLEKSLSENPHLQLECCLIAPGEDLHQIPDASVDVVVCTLVLCSAKNTEAVIKEALRVLRPASATLEVKRALERQLAQKQAVGKASEHMQREGVNSTQFPPLCTNSHFAWRSPSVPWMAHHQLALLYVPGQLLLSSQPDLWRVVLGTRILHSKEEYTLISEISEIIVHSNFTKETYQDDIALLSLVKTLKYNLYVQPICLPTSSHSISEKYACYIAGWGLTGQTEHFPERLQEAQVNLIPLQICNSEDWYGGQLVSTMICAGYEEGGIDSCKGDDGGPLMCYFPDASRYYLVGINSFGYGCAQRKSPRVYTWVPYYRNWIDILLLPDRATLVTIPHTLSFWIIGWATLFFVL